MSNAPKPAPGWWISFLRNYIIRPWMAFRRMMRTARSWIWRMITAPFRLLSRNPKGVVDEVSDAALDAIPTCSSRIDLDKSGTGRHRAENIGVDGLLLPASSASASSDSLAADSADALDSLVPDLPTGGYGGGGSGFMDAIGSIGDGCSGLGDG